MGYYLVAIGEDEDAAEAIGVNAPRVKRDIYMISAFLTALAGTSMSSTSTSSIPRPHSASTSRSRPRWCRSSAHRHPVGPVIGTVLLENDLRAAASWLGSSIGGIQLTVYALILIAIILWRPTGLIGIITEAYRAIYAQAAHT